MNKMKIAAAIGCLSLGFALSGCTVNEDKPDTVVHDNPPGNVTVNPPSSPDVNVKVTPPAGNTNGG